MSTEKTIRVVLSPEDDLELETYTHWWRKTFRGGYGYCEYVPCRILAAGKKRIRIAAQLRNGGEKEILVSPLNLLRKAR